MDANGGIDAWKLLKMAVQQGPSLLTPISSQSGPFIPLSCALRPTKPKHQRSNVIHSLPHCHEILQQTAPAFPISVKILFLRFRRNPASGRHCHSLNALNTAPLHLVALVNHEDFVYTLLTRFLLFHRQSTPLLSCRFSKTRSVPTRLTPLQVTRA